MEHSPDLTMRARWIRFERATFQHPNTREDSRARKDSKAIFRQWLRFWQSSTGEQNHRFWQHLRLQPVCSDLTKLRTRDTGFIRGGTAENRFNGGDRIPRARACAIGQFLSTLDNPHSELHGTPGDSPRQSRSERLSTRSSNFRIESARGSN